MPPNRPIDLAAMAQSILMGPRASRPPNPPCDNCGQPLDSPLALRDGLCLVCRDEALRGEEGWRDDPDSEPFGRRLPLDHRQEP